MTTIARTAGRDTTTEAGRGPRDQRKSALWIYAVLIIGLLLLIGPFIWMLLGSFKTNAELRTVPPTWLPANWTMENYEELFTRLDFPRYFLNSTIVALSVTAGNLVFCSMLGYALAKLNFRGKRLLFLLVLGTLMVPGVVMLTPLFVIVANLGLTGSHLGLIVPFLAGPFGVFLMRQFIQGIPDELLAAARVDGAGEWYIFWRIVMPLCGAALATLGILTFLGQWNNFLWPLVAAQNEDIYTLPVALALFAIDPEVQDYGLQMAGAVVTVLPILILFLVLQRYFTQGIAMTGIK